MENDVFEKFYHKPIHMLTKTVNQEMDSKEIAPDIFYQFSL